MYYTTGKFATENFPGIPDFREYLARLQGCEARLFSLKAEVLHHELKVGWTDFPVAVNIGESTLGTEETHQYFKVTWSNFIIFVEVTCQERNRA
jgi:hypothetical protein